MQKRGTGKSYRLKREVAPLSFILQSRNQRRRPLVYFDEEKNISRALRYASNQKSPFEDEQQGELMMTPIIFEDGQLFVPNTNPVLQKFLAYHPDNGVKFEEVNEERNAEATLEKIEREIQAMDIAKEMELEQFEMVARVGLNIDVKKYSSKELRRDVLMFARNYPNEFMTVVNSPELQVNDIVARCYEDGLLRLRNKGRDVYFNLPNNKSKLITIPPGENKIYAVSEVLRKDEGIEVLKLLKKHINE